jgi:hypothetical protein
VKLNQEVKTFYTLKHLCYLLFVRIPWRGFNLTIKLCKLCPELRYHTVLNFTRLLELIYSQSELLEKRRVLVFKAQKFV